jgi:hypothetical protein
MSSDACEKFFVSPAGRERGAAPAAGVRAEPDTAKKTCRTRHVAALFNDDSVYILKEEHLL